MDYFEDPDTGPTRYEQSLLDHIGKLEARITELQASGTDLLMAKRAIDRRSMVAHFGRTVLGRHPADVFVIGMNSEATNLAMSLVEEEFVELSTAYEAGNFIETADALADLAYVVEGMALALGIDLDAVFAEVHASNLTKGGSSLRADGKLTKDAASYRPPDIKGVLFGHQLTHKGTK